MSDEDFNTVTVGVQVRDDVVVISDPEDGNTSITNAIDSVLAQVYSQNPDAPRVVLYRDASGVYDGVAVDDEGQFQNFYPIQTTDADHAAAVAVAFIVEAPERFH
jgi:hypothetical protein